MNEQPKQYRSLEVGEIVQGGDEVFYAGMWQTVEWSIGQEILSTDVGKLRREIKPEPSANGWQSMDTAPKDGTWVLAWYPHSRLVKIANWAGGYWYNDGYHAISNPPSHWQSLPEGPTE